MGLGFRFIVYKLPRSHHSTPAGGMKYMYQDGHTQGWVLGRSLMNSTEGAVGRTLQQLYSEAAWRQVSLRAGVASLSALASGGIGRTRCGGPVVAQSYDCLEPDLSQR